ncbi:hypothetical protein [Paraclostridium sordellii]|nr:hypothetical protein [Paeniclostridium sordellii]
MICEQCDCEIKYEVYEFLGLYFCDFDCLYDYIKENMIHNYLK